MLDSGEVTDDLVRDMVEVLMILCTPVRRPGGAQPAITAVGRAQRDVGPAAFVDARGEDDCRW